MLVAATDRLESLLAEGIDGARERESKAFDVFGDAVLGRMVFFGAGGLGRRTAGRLASIGIRPIAYCDNNAKLWGTDLDGIPVLSPVDAAERFGRDAVFVVTIWGAQRIANEANRMLSRIGELRRLGCERVVPFSALYWKYPDRLLPYYCVDLPHRVQAEADDIRRAYHLWSDERSRNEFVDQVRCRLDMDFAPLSPPVAHADYFPKDLCELIDEEAFVDCGAFDGDTIALFLDEAEGRFARIDAFEPDPANYAKLRERVERLDRRAAIETYPYATGARRELLHLIADGSEAARIGKASHAGVLEIESVALDDVLKHPPTYVKMDIEGAEAEALRGARRLIAAHAPILAISAYHRQNDVWQLPLLIASIHPEYAFFLRPHKIEVWDLVCYAIPTHRLRRRS